MADKHTTKSQMNTLAINSQSDSLIDQIVGWHTALLLASKLDATSIKVAHFCRSSVDAKKNNKQQSVRLQLSHEQLILLNDVGLTEKALFSQCNACHSLGHMYKDWSEKGQNFPLVTAEYGVNFNNIEFHHYLTAVQLSTENMKANNEQKNADIFHSLQPFEQYALGAVMAKSNKFVHPVSDQRSILSTYDYCVNVDAFQYLELIRTKALAKGVIEYCEEICALSRDENNQTKQVFISLCDSEKTTASVKKQATAVDIDFLFECVDRQTYGHTNQSQEISAQVVDYRVNKASINSPITQVLTAILPTLPTLKTTCDFQTYTFGYAVVTQLQNKRILHVYYQEETTVEMVLGELAREGVMLELKDINIHQHVSFITRNPWQANTLVLGKASANIEPLAGNILDCVHHDIYLFLKNFPSQSNLNVIGHYYNQLHYDFYQHIADFVQLHYQLSLVKDSAFWLSANEKALVPSQTSAALSHFLAVFKQTGVTVQFENHYKTEKYWRTLLMGFNCFPDSYDPLIDDGNIQAIANKLDSLRCQISKFSEKLPSYHHYLKSQGL